MMIYVKYFNNCLVYWKWKSLTQQAGLLNKCSILDTLYARISLYMQTFSLVIENCPESVFNVV